MMQALTECKRWLHLGSILKHLFFAVASRAPSIVVSSTHGRDDAPRSTISAAAHELGERAAIESARLTQRFDELRKLYAGMHVDFPALRDMTFAQWAHESDFGRSQLARDHLNFAGMKWLAAMAPLARPVRYRPAHDPDGRDYCGFDTLENFIVGYWQRLDLPSLPYSNRGGGWRRHVETPDMFIDFIGPIWAPRGGSNSPFNDRYEAKVRMRYRQLRDAGLLPTNVSVVL